MSVKFGIAARAVYENPIIEMLLEKYSDLLSNKMGISNISIFSLYDHHWECLMAEGACKDMNGQIDIDAELSAMKDITYVNDIEDNETPIIFYKSPMISYSVCMVRQKN